MKTNLTVTGEKRRLPERIELVLFRITQEAIRNTWRHLKASRVDLEIIFTSDKLSIVISDDGEDSYQRSRWVTWLQTGN